MQTGSNHNQIMLNDKLSHLTTSEKQAIVMAAARNAITCAKMEVRKERPSLASIEEKINRARAILEGVAA